jgi:hypothetical protein
MQPLRICAEIRAGHNEGLAKPRRIEDWKASLNDVAQVHPGEQLIEHAFG